MTFTEEEITEIYVATFNRAPDESGLNYWMNDSGFENIEDIASSFFDSDEAQEIYSSATSSEDMVQSAYQNLFSRDADADGLEYWSEQLDNGSVSQSLMLQAMINGAQGEDELIMQNKTQVGIDFANRGIDDDAIASSILEDIDFDMSSVEDAFAFMDTIDFENDFNNVAHDNLGGFTGNLFNGMMSFNYADTDEQTYLNDDVEVIGVVNVETDTTTDSIA